MKALGECILVVVCVITRLVFARKLGLFGVHLLKFTLDTYLGSLMHYLVGLLEFRLEFAMPYTSQHTRDVPNLLYDCHLITAFIGFSFPLVFTCTFTDCLMSRRT